MIGRADRLGTWELGGIEAERGGEAGSDEKVVVQLFDELRSPLLRYLRALGLSTQDAEELVQDSFLALFEHLRRGRPRQNLRGWVFRVAHNLGLKRRRAGAREADAGAIEQMVDARANPEQQLLSSDREKRIDAVLGALAEQDRCCLALRAEGLRYREIGEVLDMSLGAVAASLARSLARVGKAIRA
jgi:RNA polymerase sigma-70 factor (ECF subfamily)